MSTTTANTTKTPTTTMTCFATIPHDLLNHILTFLTNKHILFSCMFINKAWARSSATYLLQHQLPITSALASLPSIPSLHHHHFQQIEEQQHQQQHDSSCNGGHHDKQQQQKMMKQQQQTIFFPKHLSTTTISLVNAISHCEQIQNWSNNTLAFMFDYCYHEHVSRLTLYNIQSSHLIVLDKYLKRLNMLRHVSISFNTQFVSFRHLIDQIFLSPITTTTTTMNEKQQQQQQQHRLIDQLETIELKSLGHYKQIDNDSFMKLFNAIIESKSSSSSSLSSTSTSTTTTPTSTTNSVRNRDESLVVVVPAETAPSPSTEAETARLQAESTTETATTTTKGLYRLVLDGCYCYLDRDKVNLHRLMTGCGMRELVLRDSMDKHLIYTNPSSNILHWTNQLTLLEFSYSGIIEYSQVLKGAIEHGCANLHTLKIFDSALEIKMKIDESDANRSFILLPKLKHLSIRAAVQIDEAFFVSDPDWSAVFMRLESLEYVELGSTKLVTNNISSTNFSDVLKQCISLKSLKMNHVEGERLDSSVFNFLDEEQLPRTFEYVDLSDTTIDSRAIVSILKHNPNLRELKATCSYGLHHQTTMDSYAMNFGTEFMTLYEEEDNNQSSDNNGNGGSMSSGNLGDSSSVNSEQQQQQQKSVKTYRLSMMDEIATPHMNLKRIDLSNCVISDSFLIYLFTVARNVKEICLEGTIRNEILTIDTQYPSDAQLRGLRSVELQGADISLCSFVVRQLDKLKSSNLTSLNLSGMVRLSINEFNSNDLRQMFDSLCSLLKQCTQLQKLNVNDFEWFDNVGLLSIGSDNDAGPAPLRRLHLANTASSIDSVSTLNLGSIQSLELTGCMALSDLDSIHDLIKKCTNVNKLTLDIGSTGVTTQTLQLLYDHCQHLTHLKLVGRPKRNQTVSEESFIQLFELSALRYISVEFNPLSNDQRFQSLIMDKVKRQRFPLQYKIPHPSLSQQEMGGINSDLNGAKSWWLPCSVL